ncbi:SWIB/MDM2 domain-containing protein [Absidia repens]|uniref:SWIB/MDM2 domain-containing protein n=1 Tax=Absidia repens TaxID=90262 RepID=A0A1X2IHI6_9FUNG|nr:SWIB/MDM2 domain-containing protein [Absidia repens]
MLESTIAVPMKKPKKKKKKKEPEDPNAPPKPKRNTGLNKPLILSAELSTLMGGEAELSRPEIVKRLWVHIKGNNLQDPKDRRFILCDDKLKAIFNVDRVNSFGMNRDLSKHLTKKEEPVAAPAPAETATASATATTGGGGDKGDQLSLPSSSSSSSTDLPVKIDEIPSITTVNDTTTTTTTANNANVKQSPTVTADTPDDVVTPQEGEHVHVLNGNTSHHPLVTHGTSNPLASLNTIITSTGPATSSSTPLLH